MVKSSEGGAFPSIAVPAQPKRRLQCRLERSRHDVEANIPNYAWSCQWMGKNIMITYHSNHP
jgi:hypothetical protein